MASPAHLFDLRTITIGEKPPTRVSAFCHKGLAAIRIDGLAPDFFKGRELWSIIILHNNTLFPIVPVFRNIDDATGFIWDISGLFPWEREFTVQELKALFKPLSQILVRYNAFPFDLVLEKHFSPEERARLSVPIPSETIR